MNSINVNDGFLIRCDIGDEIVSRLKGFAVENKIYSGTVLGIGSIKDPELGYYDIEKKIYLKKRFEGDYELLNLSGNFARFGEEVILHCHATIVGPRISCHWRALVQSRRGGNNRILYQAGRN